MLYLRRLPVFRNDSPEVALIQVQEQPRAGVDLSPELLELLRGLRDVGARVIDHVDFGSCPDNFAPHGPPPSARADGCPACDVLRKVDALLAHAPDLPAEPVTRRT